MYLFISAFVTDFVGRRLLGARLGLDKYFNRRKKGEKRVTERKIEKLAYLAEQCRKTEPCFEMGRKHCGKRRKCWFPAFSTFPTVVSFFLRVIKSQDYVVKT